MAIKDKRRCEECGHHCTKDEVDFVVDPKDDANGWIICPECRSAESMRVVCDDDECLREATCGIPTPDDYRTVCGEHYREIDKARG